jgi:FKBP-type peptidyl-prolyl cis-trans isomerase
MPPREHLSRPSPSGYGVAARRRQGMSGSTTPPMKGPLVTVLIFAALAGGLFFLHQHRETEAEAARLAAAQVVINQRVERFGEEALNPAIEWRSTGLGILTLKEGTGPVPIPGAEVTFHYIGRLKDGTEFQRSEKPLTGRIGQLVPGMSAGLQLMRRGGRAIIYVPPALGYGKVQIGPIPENASLIFEVELMP